MASGIEPSSASTGANAHDQKQARRGAQFGGACARREAVEAKLHADTAPRQTPRKGVRQQQLAEEDAYDERRREQPGSRVDIEV